MRAASWSRRKLRPARRRPVRRLYRFAANNKSKHKPYEDPSPSELDDEYATNPPNLGFFSTGG